MARLPNCRSIVFLLATLITPELLPGQPSLSATQYKGASPTRITTGPDGALWFTEFTRSSIGRIDTSGVITEYPVPRGSGSHRVTGITSGPDGALWFCDYGQIGRISTDGAISIYALPTPTAQPESIASGPDGALWFADIGYIGRITTGGIATQYAITATYKGQPVSVIPNDIIAGPDGAMWFTEGRGAGGAVIGRITTAGIVSEYAIPTPAVQGAMVLGSDGALWFTEQVSNKIGRITTSGVVSEYPLPPNLLLLQGITAGPDGALWFGTQYGLSRMAIDGTFQQYSGSTTGRMTAGPDGALWFAVSDGIGRAALQPAPGPFTANAVLPVGQAGSVYSAAISFSGGMPPYGDWQIRRGSLPPGLALDPSSGIISGKPSTAGTFTFTSSVRDASGAASTEWVFSITITPVDCAYAINTPGPYFPASGGAGAITIDTDAGCPWLVSSPPDWITLTSPPSGQGVGTVGFQVSQNIGGVRSSAFRTGAQAGGVAHIFTVLQQGSDQFPPVISNVLDAESARTTIVPGEWVTVYGSNLSLGLFRGWTPLDFSAAGLGNLPTTLSRVSVQFGGIPAALCYISPTQINAQAPFGITGTVPVVVTTDAISNSFNVTVVQHAPSLYVYAGDRNLYPAAVHTDGTLIGDPAVTDGATKARAGETVVLFVNGVAPSASGVIVKDAIAYTGQVAVSIGTVTATPIYTGLVEAGVFQINVTVPTALTPGDYSLAVSVEGQISPLNIILPVR